MTYRSDIDGLRSFAVLSVIFFHINADLMPGGFTGVDAFFVISGFLISSILIKEIQETSRINIKEFYRRRIKRILPSFFLVAGLTSIVAYLFLLPDDLVNFGKSLKSSLKFSANNYFATKDNYFDPKSDEFPLLHIWSLSLEERFYFIWPFTLWLLLKIKSHKKISLIIFATILTSTFYAHFLSSNPDTAQNAYFMLTTRIGELLIGCWTAFLINKETFSLGPKLASTISALGLTFLISSFYLITKKSIFPGIWVLLPCVGTALIIWTGHYHQSFVHRFLSKKSIVWIGLHSYALYLWHWPVLAFYRYLTGTTGLGIKDGFAVIIVSLGMSYLSRKFLEVPLNHSKYPFKTVAFSYFLIPSSAFYLISSVVIKTEGLPNRIQKELDRKLIMARAEITHQCHSNKRTDCWNKSDRNLPKILIFGDSHAGHFTPFIHEVFPEYNVYSISSGSCPPVLEAPQEYFEDVNKFSPRFCMTNIKELKTLLEREKFNAVFIASYWSKSKVLFRGIDEGIKATIFYLKKKNLQVYFIDDMPTFDDIAILKYYRRNYGPSLSLLPKIISEFNFKMHDDSLKKIALKAGANLVRPFEHNQISELQPPFFKGQLIYRDGNHLTKQGSEILGRAMKDHIRKQYNF